MKLRVLIPIAAAAALAAGCQVTVDNKSIDNQADAVASGAENLADKAGDAIGKAGDVVENQADALADKADRLGNRVDVNVDLGGHDDNRADAKSDRNSQ